MINNTKEGYLFSRGFLLVCASSLFFMASFNMIIPELPEFMKLMNGEKWLGWHITLFTLAAGLSRPFSGKFADVLGRLPIMLTGAAVSFVCNLIYPFILGITSFLTLRFFHGFSTGFTPTGTTAYLADIVPESKRGEALGILGISSSMGMALGPAIGSSVRMATDMNTMFYVAACFALTALILLTNIKETVKIDTPFSFSKLILKKGDFIDRDTLPAAFVNFLIVFSFGGFLTLTPIISDNAGFENKGILFTVSVLLSALTRFFAGRLSDRHGRIFAMITGCIFLILFNLVFSFSDDKNLIFIGTAFYGISIGFNAPSVFAWAVDLGKPQNRGRSMATVFIALEAGIGLGALSSGAIYQLFPNNPGWGFIPALLLSSIAIYYLISLKRKVKIPDFFKMI